MSSYTTNITHAGMDFLTEFTGDLVSRTKNCKNKVEVVKELLSNYKLAEETEKRNAKYFADPKNKEEIIKRAQEFFGEDRQSCEARYKKVKEDYRKKDTDTMAYVENCLFVAIFTDLKLSWEDIQYTHKFGILPLSIRKVGFPLEEIKQEALKRGYTLLKNKDYEETAEM